MRAAWWSSVVPIVALAAGGTACTGDDTAVGIADAAADHAGDATTDAATGDVSEAGAMAVQQLTAVRVANWSPGAPAVDLCLAPHGTMAFQGPVLAQVVASLLDAGTLDDAGVGGVPFPQVGAYFDVAPGTYDARVVAAGSPDCSVGIGTDATSLPALTTDAFATLAIVGEAEPTGGAPALSVVAFSDEGPRALPSGNGMPPLAARFINAAAGEPTVTASIATVGPGTFTLVAPFGGVGRYGPGELGADDPPIDANGYVSWQVTASATVTCAVPRPGGILTAGTFNLAGGNIITIILVGSRAATPASDGGAAGSFQVMECQDNAGMTGLLSSCVLLSQ